MGLVADFCMNSRRAGVLALAAWSASLMPGQSPSADESLKPMRQEALPRFEVATVKPSDPSPGNSGSGFKRSGHRILAVRENLVALITFAYGLHPSQLLGAPSWADSEDFDVNGEPNEPGVPTLDQMRSMYRQLLSDRFHLAFHRAKKELPVYVIQVGRSGPKLRESTREIPFPDQTMKGLGNLRETNATMAEFAGMLQAMVLDRPVLDRTGLAGRFDFTLLWTSDEFQTSSGPARAANPNDARPSLTTAFQEQLGLKLESVKAPADVLIVDKVEKPSGN